MSNQEQTETEEITRDEYAGRRVKIRGSESYGTVEKTINRREGTWATRQYLLVKMDDGSNPELGIEEVRFQ
jgi:hypothetical protein